ncbi:High-affinity branched-chain amino acid transport system permease protein LivH [Paramagnetospirillum magnetotacticum MS-1]|uniref:High-affinity branched-chain amino acid transport system permease protein LivH n=1 Tax=Paramagnetospirillum magnetotacticum MS-1 TaxID=272627 RepID=A0A0C2YH44_PARME|nr:branched-chain amino acid ABC transporter permease [Paramagnetospirillum magnetotacticum]KIL99039.1 High-affinity branched-chain amino acid transport system permease protein LivH [Paramagnetospirillum magnetotacticum MS-1]
MLELTLQSLFSGVLSGAYYALIALGLALVFGTMRVINLAHGELVLLGAYISYTAEEKLGLDPLASLPLALAVVVGTAILVYYLVSLIKTDRELNSLILTFGIGVILTNGVLMIWSADIHSATTPWYHDATILFETLFAMQAELVFAGIGILLVGAVWWWLEKSWYGRALRAVASNRDAAKLMGVNPQLTEILSFAVSGLLATVAGVAIYTAKVIQPAMGHHLTVKAFIITVLAGMGSVPGVLLGAVLLGVVESLTVTLASSALQELAGMVLFLVVLLLMPSGLFGRAKRRG